LIALVHLDDNIIGSAMGNVLDLFINWEMMTMMRKYKIKVIDTTIYRPRFLGYRLLTGLVLIADGLITILISPFTHLTCTLYTDYCFWNLSKDVERMKAKR
jgi:hypothetical protein